MNAISLTIILLVLLGIIPALLPGNTYEQELEREMERVYESSWTVKQDYGCEIYMPHGKRRCAAGTLRGSTVYMEGY